MWRGPTWININTLIYYGLMSYGFFQEARRLARIGLQEIVRCYMLHGCIYEYYDSSTKLPPAELPRKGGRGSEGGAGFGVVCDSHSSAALFIHLAHELD
jgi:neutral trehalase